MKPEPIQLPIPLERVPPLQPSMEWHEFATAWEPRPIVVPRPPSVLVLVLWHLLALIGGLYVAGVVMDAVEWVWFSGGGW